MQDRKTKMLRIQRASDRPLVAPAQPAERRNMGNTENTYGETTVDNLMEILKQYEKEQEEKDE